MFNILAILVFVLAWLGFLVLVAILAGLMESSALPASQSPNLQEGLGKLTEEDFDELSDHWLCECGNYITNGCHCPRCGREPPWGCPCSQCQDPDDNFDEEPIYCGTGDDW